MNLLNIIGLALDIIGVIIIYFYGLPPKIDSEGQEYIITGNVNEVEVKKANKYKKYATFGLSLLICGFLFQIFGNL